MELIKSAAIGLLFGVGIFLLLRRNILRSVIGLMTISNAINLLLLSTGAYNGILAAYDGASGVTSDPLPQALILTAIVISMGGLSFVLSLIYIISVRYQTSDSDEIRGLVN